MIVSNLPFVQMNPSDRSISHFWVPPIIEGESYTDACARGRGYADMLLATMIRHSNPLYLRLVMGSIFASDGRGPRNGVEIGFVNQIAVQAMAGADLLGHAGNDDNATNFPVFTVVSDGGSLTVG
jgi:hypothetical protein